MDILRELLALLRNPSHLGGAIRKTPTHAESPAAANEIDPKSQEAFCAALEQTTAMDKPNQEQRSKSLVMGEQNGKLN